MTKRPKISIIGGGNVGSSCAIWAASKELGDIVVLDLNTNTIKGKMLDLAQCSPVELFDSKITGTSDYKDIEGSDVVVITAGMPRKPGMSRDDLIKVNVEIVKSVSLKIKEHAPNAIVIVVSNPLDAMVYTCWKATGFPVHRIMGQAGALDVARYKTFIAMETGFSVEDISALLLGGHGDDMVPLVRHTTVCGIPISELMPVDRISVLVERTRKGGGEIVNLLKTGSAYYAPAAATIQMVESVLLDRKRVLPCSVYLEGEFGISGVFMGVPVKLGARGVEQIIEIKLTDEERGMFERSAASVREVTKVTGL
jgi:malate dehydrogenase